MSGSGVIVGLDVGGAHLKLARLARGRALANVRIAPCALWRGLDQLEAALDELGDDLPADARIAATMTGELADLWPNRASGVAAIVKTLVRRFGAERLKLYAGAAGFVAAHEAGAHSATIASANWRATADALALQGEAGLLVDVGSTTTDLIPFVGGRTLAVGATDAMRMAADELVYLGIVRTPVVAIARRLPFAGAWVTPMAELFATSADVHRLTGDLLESADLHPAADGGAKTVEESARRLLRMVGADLDPSTAPAALALARFLAEAQLRRLHDAAVGVLSRPELAAIETVVGAGVGRFLAKRLAKRLALGYRDVADGFTDDPHLGGPAADCAPAVAVARLFAVRNL